MTRAWTKHFVELALVRSGVALLARQRRRRQCLILGYHNVVPNDAPPCGDRSLHLARGDFERQLDALQSTHEVVSLDELRHAHGHARPLAVITFDDAYRGAIDLALPILRERGLTSTVFTAPGILGREGLWWDLLAGDDLDADVRRHVLDAFAGSNEAACEWAGFGRSIGSLTEFHSVVTEDELRRAAADGLTRIGSHSWSHSNLTRLDGAMLRDELARSLAWLRARFQASFIPWLAYPYGLANADVESAALEIGYEGALLIAGGWAAPGYRNFSWPRLNVPAGITRAGFELRLSGVLAE